MQVAANPPGDGAIEVTGSHVRVALQPGCRHSVNMDIGQFLRLVPCSPPEQATGCRHLIHFLELKYRWGGKPPMNGPGD